MNAARGVSQSSAARPSETVPSRNNSRAMSLAASCDTLPWSSLAADTRSAGSSRFTAIILFALYAKEGPCVLADVGVQAVRTHSVLALGQPNTASSHSASAASNLVPSLVTALRQSYGVGQTAPMLKSTRHGSSAGRLGGAGATWPVQSPAHSFSAANLLECKARIPPAGA